MYFWVLLNYTFSIQNYVKTGRVDHAMDYFNF